MQIYGLLAIIRFSNVRLFCRTANFVKHKIIYTEDKCNNSYMTQTKMELVVPPSNLWLNVLIPAINDSSPIQ